MAYHGVSPVSFESVSAVTASPSVEIGTFREQSGEKYVYAYNAGNSQISKGRFAVLSGVSGLSVTVSSISGDFAAGFVKHTTLTTGTYGWLMVRGFADSVKAPANSALAAGDNLVLGVDGIVGNVAAAGYQVVGRCMVATASAGTGSAFISVF